MSNTIEVKKSFQERMADRVRESIGELMTDDELKIIIERSVNEFLFTERTDPEASGYNKRKKPSLMQDL